jgi:hypothetical protein
VSGHVADAGSAWFVPLSGGGNQIGRGLAQNGERLGVLVHSTAPMLVGAEHVNAPAWPAAVLAQFAVDGKLMWMRSLSDTSEHLAVSRTGTLVVTEREAGCPRMRGFHVDGDEQWATACEPSSRVIDAVHVGWDGTIVSGGRNLSPEGGELFLAAHDEHGAPLGSVESPAYPYEHDSTLDGIAIEPTGEVAFIATVNHPFDFGNGMLPFEGGHDAVIVKLDSPRGHDGPVVLLRE